VYKEDTCMKMLGGKMIFWTKCFYFLTYFPKKKRKTCECRVITRTRIHQEFELLGPPIQGTKLLFQVKKAIIMSSRI